jgi:hypothetical protein
MGFLASIRSLVVFHLLPLQATLSPSTVSLDDPFLNDHKPKWLSKIIAGEELSGSGQSTNQASLRVVIVRRTHTYSGIPRKGPIFDLRR